ncbi:MAG: SDR family NAD(P)-dependent oxidoreductase [Clostridia bacterium]|nr:SDR family NAD(P)-dependent oxidoreductase [Clostridia bacterium]
MKKEKTANGAVLITGAAGGMGNAAAKLLADEGHPVYGVDLREPEDLSGMTFFRADLTDPGSVKSVFEKIEAENVRIECIVHAAGIYELDSVIELDEDAWRRVYDINLNAVWRVNRVFFPLLANGGRIIIITSELAPLDPLPFTGIYAASKAALDKYADVLRAELSLLSHPVTVLRPGAVDTGLLDVSVEKLEKFCSGTENFSVSAERFRRIVDRVEARKIPPFKVAEAVCAVMKKKRPPAVKNLNRNPLMLLLNALPVKVNRAIVRKILTSK